MLYILPVKSTPVPVLFRGRAPEICGCIFILVFCIIIVQCRYNTAYYCFYVVSLQKWHVYDRQPLYTLNI